MLDYEVTYWIAQKYWSGKIPSQFHLPSWLKESLKVTNTPHNHKKEVGKFITSQRLKSYLEKSIDEV